MELAFKPNFSIEPKYALLVGETSIIYARPESTVVDIVGFFKKGYRTGYYCHELLNPSDVLNDLKEVSEYDPQAFEPIVQGFDRSVLLRNALAHSVPCGGEDGYDVLHFQSGLIRRGSKKPAKKANPYRNAVFSYDYLLQESKELAKVCKVASDYFYLLRARAAAGEVFPGEPC